jgi:hypothetical protein
VSRSPSRRNPILRSSEPAPTSTAALQLAVRSGRDEHIGDPREPPTHKVHNLGVQDILGEQQFAVFKGGNRWGRVREEFHSVDCEFHRLSNAGTHQSPREEVTDAATAANSMPVDRGVCDVVQDRHIGHPANPYTVGAEDRPPKMLAQKHWRIGDPSQYSPDCRRTR